MLRRMLFIIGLTFVLPMVTVTSTSAKIPKQAYEWLPVTDSDWAVQQDTSKKIFDAAMLFENIIKDDKDIVDKKCYFTVYRRIRILSDEGRSLGDITVPFIHLKQKIKYIGGRTILRDGTIIDLDKKDIFKKEVFKTKGAKYTERSFSLRGVTNDCIVEYQIVYKAPSAPREWLVQKDIPLLKMKLVWKLLEYDFHGVRMFVKHITPNYLWLNSNSKTEITHLPSIKKTTEIVFESDFVAPYESEIYSIPDAALRSKIICYYGSNEPAVSYWGGEATDMEERLKAFCLKNKRLKNIVEEFKLLPDEQEKIKAAYNWVQDSLTNITYFDLYDRRKPDKIIPPHKIKDNKSVNDVIKRSYGHRWEINVVFIDMLREMNIDARLCFAKSRVDDILVEHVKYWQFDNSLVAVVDQNKELSFYSPGNICTPLAHIPWFLEGVVALMHGTDNSFRPIPFSTPELTTNDYHYRYTIGDEFEVTGNSISYLRGHSARTIRYKMHDEDSLETTKIIKEYIADKYSNAELEVDAVDNIKSAGDRLVIKCSLSFDSYSEIGGRILLKPFDHFQEIDNPFLKPERHTAILFDYSYVENETATFALPTDWTLETVPGDTTFANAVGECKVEYFSDVLGISIKRQFVLFSPFWSLEQYPEIRNLFQARQTLSDQIVVLKRQTE